MSAPEAWVACPTCSGDGEITCHGETWPHPKVCPDCASGLVPSDGEIEAAASGMWDSHGMDYSRRDVLPDYLVMARAALVAARRYQRKAEEL